MKEEWLMHCMDSAVTQADLYSGARKILRNQHLIIDEPKDDLQLADIGFAKQKMSTLRRLYLHEESRAAAVELWDGRLRRAKYGSVGFHCFNHYVKGNGDISYRERYNKKSGKTSRASVMGPCIQSVSITWVDKKTIEVNLFYRTTELFKKFPADLVFIRDELLTPFNFEGFNVSWSFHFANVTCHPMYLVTLLPHYKDPLRVFHRLKQAGPYFHNWCVKWTRRYLDDDHGKGIEKFSQAMRVRHIARSLLSKQQMENLLDYFKRNPPPSRSTKEEVGELEADELEE